jgi:hypothetical protein
VLRSDPLVSLSLSLSLSLYLSLSLSLSSFTHSVPGRAKTKSKPESSSRFSLLILFAVFVTGLLYFSDTMPPVLAKLANGQRTFGDNFGNLPDTDDYDELYYDAEESMQIEGGEGDVDAELAANRMVDELSSKFETMFELPDASRRMIEAGAGTTVDFALDASDAAAVKVLVADVDSMCEYVKWHCQVGSVPARVTKRLNGQTMNESFKAAFTFSCKETYKGHVITFLAWLLVAEGGGGASDDAVWKEPNWKKVVNGDEDGDEAAPAAPAAPAAAASSAPVALPFFSEDRVVTFIKAFLVPRGKVRRDKGTEGTHEADAGGRFGLISVSSLNGWMLSLQNAANETTEEHTRRGKEPAPQFKQMHEYVQ